MIATATAPAALAVREFYTEHLGLALALVEKCNRKAARAGIENRFTVAHSTTTVEFRDATGFVTEVNDITTFAILGTPLVLAGWEFVATITWDSETGLAVTRVVPGVEVDLSGHRDAQVCEHCNLRRARIDTYVVRETSTGVTRQVGSSCLVAFLGIDPSAALWYVGETFAPIDFEFGGRIEIRFPLAYTVALASAAIAEFGWVPASSFEGVPTKSRVLSVLCPASSGPQAKADKEVAERLTSRLVADSNAQDRADAVIAWAATAEGSSEYIVNLRAAFAGTTISTRNLGLVVSAPSAWSRTQERALAAARTAATAAVTTSTHQGALKERLVGLSLTVTAVHFLEGQYGVTTLLTFIDAAGNVFKWFASGTHDYAVGTALVLTGTVKAHTVYRDVAQTVLTRCKEV